MCGCLSTARSTPTASGSRSAWLEKLEAQVFASEGGADAAGQVAPDAGHTAPAAPSRRTFGDRLGDKDRVPLAVRSANAGLAFGA
jgi:hypothetical protein